MTINKQINYVKSIIIGYKNDVQYSPYISVANYAKSKLEYYESILKSLEKLNEINKEETK